MVYKATQHVCAQPKARAKVKAKTEDLEALAAKGSKAKGTRGAEKEEAALEAKALVEKAGAEKAKVAGSAKDKAGATRDTASRAARRATKHSSADEEHRKPRTP